MVLIICGYGGTGRLEGFRWCHLGERFLRHPCCGHSSVKAGTPVFINADQALRSASVPRRVKTEGNKIATDFPAAHICGYGGNGRLGGFRFLCREACGFESHYPYHNWTPVLIRWVSNRVSSFFLQKSLFVRVLISLLTKAGSAVILKWSPWSLFRFTPLYHLTKGLWGVHFEPRGVHLLIITFDIFT